MTTRYENRLRVLTTADRKRAVLPSFKGTGVLPGVNMDDWAGVMDLMEQGEERR